MTSTSWLSRTPVKIVLSLVLVIAVVGLLWGRDGFIKKQNHSRRISCWNHASFIEQVLMGHIPENEKRTYPEGWQSILQMPFDPALSGYGLFAKFTAVKNGPMVNCNHGAPHSQFGGWQALNLPGAKLKQLSDAWQQQKKKATVGGDDRWKLPRGLPYAWCGGPVGEGELRICITVVGGDEPGGRGWAFDREVIDERGLELLNQCLESIGEKRMPVDVPRGVDWAQFAEKK